MTVVGHLEQLDTRASADTHPELWLLDTTYLALIPPGAQGALPPTPHGTGDRSPADRLRPRGRRPPRARRLRGKLSYSNVAFALAPERFTLRELAALYEAVLGYVVSPTNLGRVLGRDGLIAPTGATRAPAGSAGGRPAAEFAFSRAELVVLPGRSRRSGHRRVSIV